MAINKEESQQAIYQLTDKFGDTQLDKNKIIGDNQKPGIHITKTPKGLSMLTQTQSRPQDDDKEFFINQIKAITATLSIPLSPVITPLEGDSIN
jgi:hypothetical protein